MLRRCTGEDKTLIRLNTETNQYENCACGTEFDDADCLVIYPHSNFQALKKAAEDLLAWEKELGDLDGSIGF